MYRLCVWVTLPEFNELDSIAIGWYLLSAEAQTQLAGATEKERFASEKLMEVTARLSSLESQISSLRQERSQLLADLEVERTKFELMDEAKTKSVSAVLYDIWNALRLFVYHILSEKKT